MVRGQNLYLTCICLHTVANIYPLIHTLCWHTMHAPISTTDLKKGTNGCMIEGCLTCVHLTMFTTILSKCSLMFWSLILLFGQVITIPINPEPVNPTPSIRPFKPSFDEECVEATIWYFDVKSGHITLHIRFSGDWKALQISFIDLTFGFLGDCKNCSNFQFLFFFSSVFSQNFLLEKLPTGN